MRIRGLSLLCLLCACGSEPASGPDRDATGVDSDVDPTDASISDASPGEPPSTDVPSVDTRASDVRPGDAPLPDVPFFDVPSDGPEPDGLPVDVRLDLDSDAPTDAIADVFDVPPSPDAEPDAVDDARPDAEPDVELECDVDGDEYLSIECGGDDCDDTTNAVNPGRVESCNFYDDDCDEEINEDLDCRVYAHTSTELYLVDPFLGTEDFVTSVPSLFDFDTDPDGNLYGISGLRDLYVFDESTDSWTRLGTFATTTGNGFAIDSDRVGYMTAGNHLYTIDIDTSVATLVGAMGEGFWSSGDCVVDKSDQLFMTSTGPGEDLLIAVSRVTGVGRRVGGTGFSGIWGLTAAWGHLFGFTSSGQVVELDPGTGEGRLVHTIRGRSWYGAASSPGR